MVRTRLTMLVLSTVLLGTVLLGAGLATTPVPALPPGSIQPPAAGQQATLARGQALVQAFYAVQVEPVWQAFTPEMQAAWGSLEAFRSYREAGVREYGPEARVLSERVVQQDDLTLYVRTAVFAAHPQEAWSVVLGFDAAGRLALFTIVLEGGLPGDPTNQS